MKREERTQKKGTDQGHSGSQECQIADCQTCKDRGTCEDPRAVAARVAQPLKGVKNVILVGSGKGGVGKSTISVSLALALSLKGHAIGLMDADITGPNIPKLLGIEDMRLRSGPQGIEPGEVMGIKVISMALLLSSRDTAVVWRGPMKMAAIKQFVSDVNWGDLDYLIVDLPPGTSDEPISLVQLIPQVKGAVIVTTPQDVAVLDSMKAVSMFRLMKVPVLGMIENMSGLKCPHCGTIIEVFKKGGGEKAARDMDVEFLGAVPLDPGIGRLADSGKAEEMTAMASWESLKAIAEKIDQMMA